MAAITRPLQGDRRLDEVVRCGSGILLYSHRVISQLVWDVHGIADYLEVSKTGQSKLEAQVAHEQPNQAMQDVLLRFEIPGTLCCAGYAYSSLPVLGS